MDESSANLWAALLGALVGGACSLVATLIAHYLYRKDEERREKAMVASFLQGVHDEISTLWTLYQAGVGKLLDDLDKGVAFEYIWITTQEHFTVFRTNAHLLGMVGDSSLRKVIISTYMKGSGILDSLAMNTELAKQLGAALLNTNAAGEVQPETAKFTIIQSQMLDSANKLKLHHEDLKDSVKDLLRRINDALGKEADGA